MSRGVWKNNLYLILFFIVINTWKEVWKNFFMFVSVQGNFVGGFVSKQKFDLFLLTHTIL